MLIFALVLPSVSSKLNDRQYFRYCNRQKNPSRTSAVAIDVHADRIGTRCWFHPVCICVVPNALGIGSVP
jgi:hypothetical protein